MANKKNTVKYILCGILVLACAVFTTMGVIAIVKEIAKDAKVRKEIESSVDAEYDVINYNSTNQTTDPNLNRSRLKITEEVFLMRSLII